MKNKLPKVFPYNNVIKITGPYIVEKRDGLRRIIFVYNLDGSKTKINYARYLLETNLKIKLEKNQHVHHKDENKLNDSLENLEILSIEEHTRLHSRLEPDKIKECIVCKSKFILTIQQQSDERRSRKVRKFCSTKCSMKYQYNWKQYAKPEETPV